MISTDDQAVINVLCNLYHVRELLRKKEYQEIIKVTDNLSPSSNQLRFLKKYQKNRVMMMANKSRKLRTQFGHHLVSLHHKQC